MVNLLALWRAHGIDAIMREAHRRGIALCGYSAGSMCWFEAGISRGGGAPAFRVSATAAGEVSDRRLDCRLMPSPVPTVETGLEEMRELRRMRLGAGGGPGRADRLR